MISPANGEHRCDQRFDLRALSTVRLFILFSIVAVAASHWCAAGDPSADAPGANSAALDSGLAFFELEESADTKKADEPNFDALDKRLKEIEDAWSKQQADSKQKQAEADCKPTYQIHGRIHGDYWTFPRASAGIGFFEHSNPALANYGTDPEDLFAFRRVRLEMQGTVLESMLWRMHIDFNNPQTPEFKDVYIGFGELPFNQTLIIGNQKRPLGLDQLNSSKNNVFLERPFAQDAFNDSNRRPGIMMQGYADDESLGWSYGVFLLEDITTTGQYRGDQGQTSLNARLFGSPWYEECTDGCDYWHWGVSGMIGFPDANPNNMQASDVDVARYRSRPEARTVSRWFDTGNIIGSQAFETFGLESMFNSGPLQITAEYETNWTQRGSIGDSNLFFHGGYIYAAWMLTGEHIPYNRQTGTIGRLKPRRNVFCVDRDCAECGQGWGAWQLGLRYSYIDLTDNDITGGIGHSGTLALNWFFNEYAKLQFNLIYGSIHDRGPIGGYTSGTYLIAGTRLAIEF
ncbi:MAG: ATPase [Planctomycetaceae bacterium]|nr:ATPase [Planctomycetaceae bacterium]